MSSLLRFTGGMRIAPALLLLLAPAFATAAEANTSRIINVPIDAKTITVQVTGSDAELASLMQAAFRVHGGFAQPPAGQPAQYTLRFDRTDPTTVTATVSPTSGTGGRFQATGKGGTWREAAYRAGDEIVGKLTGKPGFFAGKLVFVSKRTGRRELFTSDLLGQEVRQLTQFKSECIHPRWSPNGAKILFTGYHRTGFPDIMLLDFATGSINERFAAFKGTNTGAVFSPDGSKVAMILSATGNPELYVSGADGKNPNRLTSTPDGVEASPAWTPDGARIVFSSDPQGAPQLNSISATGGSLKRIPTNIVYSAEPSCNPDGKGKIAFTANVGGGFQIAVYDPATGRSSILTSGPGSCLEPIWANDGVHIIYTRREGRNETLAIVNADNKRAAPLTSRDAAQADFVYTK